MYPTEEQIETIKKWNPADLHGLMEFIQKIWTFADWGWRQEDQIYYISTGGWSGNEEIIEAMRDNLIWWAFFWEQSKRGGHYIFATIKDSLHMRGVDVKVNP